ncbi:MAG: hypothetical protein ACLQFR_02555 [Streptosporangiaceae bacterium]
MPSMRIASPERRWRAATTPLVAGLLGWVLAGSFRLGLRPGATPGLPLTARITVTCVAVAVGLCLAVLIMRTHLMVSDDGLADHRTFRVVRVPWQMITGLEVGRPKALWGGFCVTAVCCDGTTIDLMSARAYSRVPSAQHLDELARICWSLEEAATKRPV